MALELVDAFLEVSLRLVSLDLPLQVLKEQV